MSEGLKRKAEGSRDSDGKKQKSGSPRKWRVDHKDKGGNRPGAPTLNAGDSGIWVTCDRGAEGKCIAELRDLFNEYGTKLYGGASSATQIGQESGDDDAEIDIEAEIQSEIKKIQQTSRTPLFQPIRIDASCLVFFKTRPPVEPGELVHRICSDAHEGTLPFRGRFIKRLTPITLMGKATEHGLKGISEAVLKPDFHTPDAESKKFAIRPSLRSHSALKRDDVIKQVAEAVGPKHTVDLKNYDRCILLEAYKNMCGMAVVGSDYETLKRYNLAEIWLERKEKDKASRTERTEEDRELVVDKDNDGGPDTKLSGRSPSTQGT